MIPHPFKQIRTFFIFLLLIIISPSASFAEADKIFKENSKAVVVVMTFNEKDEPKSQGSGFVVRADGAVVTNYHVISNAKGIKVKAGDKVLDVEGLIYEDKANDLVILKAKGEKLPIVKIGDIDKEIIGEKVYVISSPRGLENTISDGILSGIREITHDKKVLQITAPISPGSSGSPVFNKNGEVIGIATFLLEEAQNLNFAMPINLIVDKINNTKITKIKDSHMENYENTAEYYYNLGLAYSDLGKYQEAVDAYKQAIRIKPDDANAHIVLAFAYSELGKYQEAIDANKQVIRIKPDYASAHFGLGLAYGALGKYQEAVDAYKQAIRIEPDDALAHFQLGSAYSSEMRYKEAIEAFKQAIKIKPDVEAHYNLGVIYGDLGMHKEAIDAYKQAIRIKPDYKAHINLGNAYNNLGNYKEA
ncbi:MAG TPA: tetratricopeptide repeat protein, partial [Nitrospirae bacterium]|nr:tetratricopeptide repeat protein [Nitrospirota bacterium]